MAVCLPSDLLHCVLETWLGADVKYLSKLDVAICNHSMRADLMAVLTKITSPKKVYGDKVTLTLNYIQWIVARKVKMLELMVGLEDIQGVVEGIRFFAPIPSVQKVYFDEPTDENGCQVDFNPSVGMFAVFLSKFPSLKWFGGWWTMTDDHLAIVRSFGYNLEKIDVISCPFLSSSAVAAFISSVASSLENLRCSSLNDEGLLALSGQSFPLLNGISIDCWYITDADAIAKFCAAVADTVESLSLYVEEDHHVRDNGNSHPGLDCFTPKLVKSIVKSCRCLTSLYFESADAVECLCLRAVLADAANMRDLTLGMSRFTFTESKGWEIDIQNDDTAVVKEAIAGFSGHVSAFSFKHKLNNKLFRSLVTKFGANLTYLLCGSDDNVNDNTVAYILPRLSSLETFCFGSCHVTGKSLRLLPVYCPKITVLELCANISDEGMCAILDGYKGAGMKELKLGYCKLLTDLTLVKIADTFPDLDRLDIDSTSVRKETVVRLIATKKLRAKKLRCPETDWVKKQLEGLGQDSSSIGGGCVIC